MGKKCIICGADAIYIIKDTSDSYCQECALDCFNDVSFLQKVEEQALELKELIKDMIEEDDENNDSETYDEDENIVDRNY